MTSFDPTDDATDDDAIDETDWLAVRYVLGELPSSEATTFEERLADDQDAREAVARASQLVQTLTVAPWPVHSILPVRRRLQRFAGPVAATAAAVLVSIVAYRSSVDRDGSLRPAADDVDPARLVVLWSDSAGTLNGVAEGEPSDDAAAADPFDALLPPDWLLAAVEHEAMPDADAPSLDPDSDSDEIERN